MNFDALAPHYRWIEWLFSGGQLQRCRIAHLAALHDPQRVLIFGEGNGRFLAAFCQRYPNARVTCVEASRSMLNLATNRLRRLGVDSAKVNFVNANALKWTPPISEFDVIVTHFFLDCFKNEELSALIPVIAKAAAPKCTWLLADFRTPEQTKIPVLSKILLGILYLFFGWATCLSASDLTDPCEYLLEAGFDLLDRKESIFGLLHSDVWVARD